MSNPHGHEPKVGTGQGTGTQRSVKSTRTPATRTTRDAEPQHPHRSQTLPTPTPVSTTRRTPTPQMTMPTPSTTASSRQRTPSFPKAQPKKSPSPLPDSSRKSSLDGTGYIVEPLQPSFRSESREGRREPQVHLPPPSSLPVAKPALDSTRQSVSSFQTEPSSYYSAAEDVGSTAGTPIPPTQMPQPSHTEHEAQTSRYEALWLAAQAAEAPPMPVPELATPPMPSPHVDFEAVSYDDGENEADFEDEYQEDVEQSSIDEYEQHVDTRGQGDQSQVSWASRRPPGMPIPTSGHSPTSSSSNAPMPMPSAGRDSEGRSTHGSRHGHSRQASQTTIPEPKPTGTISTTAPLRIHHTHRPSSVEPPSPGLPPPRPSPAVSPTGQHTSQSQSIPPRFNSQHQQQHNSPAGSGFSVTSRPQQERPAGSASNAFSTSQSHHKIGSSYEGRPPGASAPSIPSGTNTSIYHNPPVNQYTGQNNTSRPSKTQYTSGPTSTVPTSSLSSHSSQPAVSTPATTVTAPSLSSTPASKPTPSSAVTPVYSNTKPAVSSNLAPQRPQANVSNAHPQQSTATTTARPPAQVLESTRPSISAPQVQHQSSTGSSAPSRPQVKIQETAPTPAHDSPSTRPRLNHASSQMDTQYVNMLLALDDIPTLHNLLAGFFNWILLAGFILFPGTFTSLQNLNATGVTAQVQHQLVNAVTHIPLFVVAWVCTGVGAFGMIWMSWRWRKNYLWGLNKIFMPGFLNSLAGLLSTLANIFGVQHGELSTTSKITLIVTSASTGVLGILAAFYTLWLVRRVKKRHDQEVGKQRTGKHGEGVVDLSKRRANGG